MKTRRNPKSTYHAKRSSHFKVMGTLAQNRIHSEIEIVRKSPDPDWMHHPQDSLPLKFQYRWYRKNRGFWANIREVAAQELCRLYLPYHPKTRLVLKDQYPGVTEIVSKEIKDKQLLSEIRKTDPAKLKTDLANYQFKGLGSVLLLSLFLNETDLKLENMMVDSQQQVIKFDSEFCFNSLREVYRNFAITAKDFNQLPFVTDYEAANWLDMRCYYYDKGCTKFEKSTIFDKDFANNVDFRAELNAMTMCLLITPPVVFERVIDSCIPEELKGRYDVLRYIEDLSEVCVIRQAQLCDAAMQNVSFQAYMQTAAAAQEVQAFIQKIRSFQSTGKRTIVVDDVISKVNETYTHLKTMPVVIAADIADNTVNLHFNA